ncbi:unnamed protein product [Caenorhabditis brenneri]
MIISDLNNMEKSMCNRVLIEKHPELQTRLEAVELSKRIIARRRWSLLFYYISMLSMVICYSATMILDGLSTIAVVVFIVLMIVLIGIGHWKCKRLMAKDTKESSKHEANLEKLLRDHPYLEEKDQYTNVQEILEEVEFFEKRYSSGKLGRRFLVIANTYFTVYPPYQLIIKLLAYNGVLDKESRLRIALGCGPHFMLIFSMFFIAFLDCKQKTSK